MNDKRERPNWDHRYTGDARPSIALQPWPKPKHPKRADTRKLCPVCNQFVHCRAMPGHLDAHRRSA